MVPESLPPAMPNSERAEREHLVAQLPVRAQVLDRQLLRALDGAGLQPDVGVQAFPALDVEGCVGQDASTLARLIGADQRPRGRRS
jgi:hypothetical protein